MNFFNRKKKIKLPNIYSSWVEFAKRCIELENKHLGITQVIVTPEDSRNIEILYEIIEIKANAFDEIISKGEFGEKALSSLNWTLKQNPNRWQGEARKELQNIIKLLGLLSKDSWAII